MRIFTYPDPFQLNKDKEMWQTITKHPHFCASDTLIQGIETEYKRNSFGIFRTIDSLIKKILGEFVDNPQNDIQLFLEVSKIIRALDKVNDNLKQAFRFNISHVVESVKFLIMLGCDSSKFDENLTEEQTALIYIYDEILKTPCISPFKKLSNITKEDYIRAVKCTINDEIKHICDGNQEYYSISGMPQHFETCNDGFVAANKIIDYLKGKLQEAPDGEMLSSSLDRDLEKVKHVLKLITDEDSSVFEKIIIHGVHRITPTMYFLFSLLEKIGVEVIFLINYAKNLPNIYKTWREVYSWCDTKFEYLADVDIYSKNPLGIAIASVIEGKKLIKKPNEEVTVFSNLTSFTDREVREVFNEACKCAKKKKTTNRLALMEKQYYAVRGESSNNILKIYFPEQFNQKPFLSYPIGQFILGIYQMWDFERHTLILNNQSLCECSVSNVFVAEKVNLFEVINKIRLYFSDIETIEDYYTRIKELETSVEIINRNNRYSPLKKIGFFNVTFHELKVFKDFLKFIESISKQLFKETNNVLDFGKHFKTLVDIISKPTLNNNILSKTEELLIKELSEKLSGCKDNEITGNLEDVKDALAFYLSTNIKGDTSNWIVRDFEQIDGAVLLSRTTKAKTYHFALLSNSHMTNQNDDVLSWPLTNEMFTGYSEVNSAIPVVTKGMLERRNFLKFSLFYGTFFTMKNIELSYIEEENGEEQVPYYILQVLGLKKEIYKENMLCPFISAIKSTQSTGKFSSAKLSVDTKELFSICPYKYLQNEVLKAPIEYSNEYHIKYFVANFMYVFIKGNYDLKSENLDKKIEVEFENIKRLFPFWSKLVFLDIEKNARGQIRAYINKDTINNPYSEYTYEKRKENFLIAQWVDTNTNIKQMKFNKPNVDEEIINYMSSKRLYPNAKELPHKKVCENCNYSDVCLRDYYNAFTSTEGDE